jgi:FemAB-related protein (PEP-CTERM system-associated)
MQIESVADPGEEWDEFVSGTPGATLGHAALWCRVLRESYRLETRYLASREGSALTGVLPLVRFRTLRGRRELVSLPFLDSAGILARSREAEQALLESALRLSRELGSGVLELRQATPLQGWKAESDQTRIDLVLPLQRDPDEQWKSLRKEARNRTRKATSEGLEIAEGTQEELLNGFYGPFQVNMRDLGSPVHAKRFFRVMLSAFGAKLRIVVTRHGSQPIGGLVAIHFGETVGVPWASSLREHRHRCPNNILYWEAMRWAIAGGAREFDFGRSPRGSGTHQFKLSWGARERAFAWRRFGSDGQPVELEETARGGLLGRLSAAWTRLPVPLTAVLGPSLRRYLAN